MTTVRAHLIYVPTIHLNYVNPISVENSLDLIVKIHGGLVSDNGGINLLHTQEIPQTEWFIKELKHKHAPCPRWYSGVGAALGMWMWSYVDGLVQERRNSIAYAFLALSHR